ncbi:MAG: hypothetical protein R3C99_21020 [Pirellulaceae bacterium]
MGLLTTAVDNDENSVAAAPRVSFGEEIELGEYESARKRLLPFSVQAAKKSRIAVAYASAAWKSASQASVIFSQINHTRQITRGEASCSQS